MAKVTKKPVMKPEYGYVLELSEDEAERLVALLGGSAFGTMDEVFDALAVHIPIESRKYVTMYDRAVPYLVKQR